MCLGARVPVEVTGDEDAALGQPVDARPAVLAAGYPQVERTLRVVDPEAGPLEGSGQHPAASQVAGALFVDMRLVAQRGHHRRLNRGGQHQTGMLAYLEQLGHHADIPGNEPGAVTRQVGALRQRVHHEQVVVAALAEIRTQHRGRLCVPAELAITLVGRQQGAVLAGRGDPAAQQFVGRDRPMWIGRRVDPDQRCPAVDLVRVVAGPGCAAGQPGAQHVVGRVGGRRDDDQAVGAQPELAGNEATSSLGADHRQDAMVVQPLGAPARGRVLDDGRPQCCGAPRSGVASVSLAAASIAGQGLWRRVDHAAGLDRSTMPSERRWPVAWRTRGCPMGKPAASPMCASSRWSLVLRRQGGHARLVRVQHADPGSATGRANVIEEPDVDVVPLDISEGRSSRSRMAHIRHTGSHAPTVDAFVRVDVHERGLRRCTGCDIRPHRQIWSRRPHTAGQ